MTSLLRFLRILLIAALLIAAKLILAVAVLLLYLTLIANIVDYKLSKQLDDVDPTNEELVQNLANTAPKGR